MGVSFLTTNTEPVAYRGLGAVSVKSVATLLKPKVLKSAIKTGSADEVIQLLLNELFFQLGRIVVLNV